MCWFGLHKHICCHTNAFIPQINQAKPECGRQTLVELLIRPVQRLPSVALLLNGNTHTLTFLALITYLLVFFSLSFSFHTCLLPPLSPVDTCLSFLVLSILFYSPFSSWFSSLPACLLLTKLFLSLTIADIKKHTSDDNPDKIKLEKAIESLKEVMTWVTLSFLLWWSHSQHCLIISDAPCELSPIIQ